MLATTQHVSYKPPCHEGVTAQQASSSSSSGISEASSNTQLQSATDPVSPDPDTTSAALQSTDDHVRVTVNPRTPALLRHRQTLPGRPLASHRSDDAIEKRSLKRCSVCFSAPWTGIYGSNCTSSSISVLVRRHASLFIVFVC